MRTSILIIAFCAVASFAVAQKSEKDRKAGLKPLKQTETKSSDEREMRKIAHGRGQEEMEAEIEESIERSFEDFDEEFEHDIELDMDMEMNFEGLDEEIEHDIEMNFDGLDEQIERDVERSLEGLDEQIEMSINASMEGLDEALRALDHLDIDININGTMVDVHQIVKEAVKDAKVEIKATKGKSRPQQ